MSYNTQLVGIIGKICDTIFWIVVIICFACVFTSAIKSTTPEDACNAAQEAKHKGIDHE